MPRRDRTDGSDADQGEQRAGPDDEDRHRGGPGQPRARGERKCHHRQGHPAGHEQGEESEDGRRNGRLRARAAANQTQFNRADGAGYDLVADVVLALDAKNPQTAARILVSFRSWRALEETRRAAAERTLRRVAGTEGLSRDVADIVTRTLA